MTEHVDVLRASVEGLSGIVEELDPNQLEMAAYPSEWTIADVLSAPSARGSDPPASTRRRHRRDHDPIGIRPTHLERLTHQVTTIPGGPRLPRCRPRLHRSSRVPRRRRARPVPLRPRTNDVRFRRVRRTAAQRACPPHLGHRGDLRSWCWIGPGRDTRLVVDNLEMTARYAGKPIGTEHHVAVRTSEPRRTFTLTLGAEAVSLEPADPKASRTLRSQPKRSSGSSTAESTPSTHPPLVDPSTWINCDGCSPLSEHAPHP